VFDDDDGAIVEFRGDSDDSERVSRGWRMRAEAADFFETRMGRGPVSRLSRLRGMGSIGCSHFFFRGLLHSWQALPSCVPVRLQTPEGYVGRCNLLFRMLPLLREGLFAKKKWEKLKISKK